MHNIYQMFCKLSCNVPCSIESGHSIWQSRRLVIRQYPLFYLIRKSISSSTVDKADRGCFEAE